MRDRTPALDYLEPGLGFLGLDAKDAYAPKDARAIIVPFGLEASSTYGGGTANGPAAILRASHEVELFDEAYWCEPHRNYGIATLRPPIVEKPLGTALDQIEVLVGTALSQAKFPLVIGGEHSLTAGAIRPFAHKYDDLVVLHIDAHADLRDGYLGEHFSHASAMRRVLDHSHIKLVSVAIRNISLTEAMFYEDNKDRISIHWAKDRASWVVSDIVKPLTGRPIYISFDVDGFDASLMPATGTPEPGGIFFDEAVSILEAASKVGTIVGADVVELAPINGMHACDFTAAKLVYKILNLALVEML